MPRVLAYHYKKLSINFQRKTISICTRTKFHEKLNILTTKDNILKISSNGWKVVHLKLFKSIPQGPTDLAPQSTSSFPLHLKISLKSKQDVVFLEEEQGLRNYHETPQASIKHAA